MRAHVDGTSAFAGAESHATGGIKPSSSILGRDQARRLLELTTSLPGTSGYVLREPTYHAMFTTVHASPDASSRRATVIVSTGSDGLHDSARLAASASVLADAFLVAVDDGSIRAEHVLAGEGGVGAAVGRNVETAPPLALPSDTWVIDARQARLAVPAVSAWFEHRPRAGEVAVAQLARILVGEPVTRVRSAHAGRLARIAAQRADVEVWNGLARIIQIGHA